MRKVVWMVILLVCIAGSLIVLRVVGPAPEGVFPAGALDRPAPVLPAVDGQSVTSALRAAAELPDQRFRSLWQQALAGDLAAGQEALRWEDQCGRLLVIQAQAGAWNSDVAAPPDPLLAAQWNEHRRRAESLCAAWQRVQPDNLNGRATLLRRMADAAESEGVPSWLVSPDAVMPGDAETIDADLRSADTATVYEAGLLRMVGNIHRLEELGLDASGISQTPVLALVPSIAACTRFGDCMPTPAEQLSLCLELYACTPGIRFDRLAESGLLSVADEQAARRFVAELNARMTGLAPTEPRER